MLTNGALSIFIATVFYLIGTGLYVFYGQNPRACTDGAAGPDLCIVYRISASCRHHRSPAGSDLRGLSVHTLHWSEFRGDQLDPGYPGAPLQKGDELLNCRQGLRSLYLWSVGIVAILISMVLANGEIKSAYEWFNGFYGAGPRSSGWNLRAGRFYKVATTLGAYVAFGVSAVVIIWVKYTQPEVSIWSYSLITIGISVVVGLVVSYIHRAVTGNRELPDDKTTIYGIGKKEGGGVTDDIWKSASAVGI